MPKLTSSKTERNSCDKGGGLSLAATCMALMNACPACIERAMSSRASGKAWSIKTMRWLRRCCKKANQSKRPKAAKATLKGNGQAKLLPRAKASSAGSVATDTACAKLNLKPVCSKKWSMAMTPGILCSPRSAQSHWLSSRLDRNLSEGSVKGTGPKAVEACNLFAKALRRGSKCSRHSP